MNIIQAIINFFQRLFGNTTTSKYYEGEQDPGKYYTPNEEEYRNRYEDEYCTNGTINGYRFRRKYLLTKHEYYFYKELKPIAYKLGYAVLAKIRMADLVAPDYPQHYHQYNGAFQKIKAKHVDFALADPTNCAITLLIELDDSSHEEKDRQERDEFIDAVYMSCGYKILHVYTMENLEEQITSLLKQET